ncbi:hypothetical protein PN499_16710 [Kamptonema animale CS-326]|jgi:hypothetical protein|uniref:hypothetical protein n=1 Tax=Kamptonema animale TaxID=92934 RepID=UPI002330B380|nr:hypothetical protein [Kamptonema animale]MDB9512832.1 hypothetical protein [Kamptonema animale CS-326]
MALKSYNLDIVAQKLVLDYRDQEVLNESHKMRQTAAYGLERFWGEHLRLLGKEKTRDAGEYWKATWGALVKIMKKGGVTVPNDSVNLEETDQILAMAKKLWNDEEFPRDDRQFTLAVLIQLCDSLVWWTQRYKKKSERDEKESEGDKKESEGAREVQDHEL